MAMGRNGEAIGSALDLGQSLLRQLGVLDESISRALDHLERGLEREQLRAMTANGIIAADGTVDLRFTPPPGCFWIVERVAATVAGAGAGLAGYLDEIQPQNLVDTDPTPQLSARGITGNGVHVPAGSSLIYHFFGATVGATATLRLRARELAVGE